MSEPSKTGRSILYRWLLVGILILFGMACVLRDLAEPIAEEIYLGPTWTEQAYQDTEDALWETAWAEAYTADAATLAAAHLTASPTAAPPHINWVYLPSVITGDKTTYYGQMEFSDQDGDVNRLTITVIAATSFEGADYDPRDYLDGGDQYAGTYRLYIWCDGQQSVTLRYTLYDRAGNQSNAVDATFVCQ